jgi:hypothetical protein
LLLLLVAQATHKSRVEALEKEVLVHQDRSEITARALQAAERQRESVQNMGESKGLVFGVTRNNYSVIKTSNVGCVIKHAW